MARKDAMVPVLVKFEQQMLDQLGRYVEHRKRKGAETNRSQVIRELVQEGLDRRKRKQ